MKSNVDLKNIQIMKIDPFTLSKKEWDRFHEYRKKKQFEVNPDDPISDNNAAEKSIKANMRNPEAKVELFFIINNKTKEQIGDALEATIQETSPSFEGNKHLVQFDMFLLAECRRKGIGTKILKQIYDLAHEQQKKVLFTGSDNDDGKAFLKVIGAQTALSGVENRLKLNEVNWSMIDEWIKEGPKRSPNTKLEVYNTIPIELLGEFCKTYTEANNQQPLGELEIGAIVFTPESYRKFEQLNIDAGRIMITMLTREPSGVISGFTQMQFNPSRVTIITQGLTGVKKEFQGHGLGKWLKAAMLLKLKKEFPKIKVITTGNATVNAPMLSINQRLGFKIHKETINAQIPIEKLADYLRSKNIVN